MARRSFAGLRTNAATRRFLPRFASVSRFARSHHAKWSLSQTIRLPRSDRSGSPSPAVATSAVVSPCSLSMRAVFTISANCVRSIAVTGGGGGGPAGGIEAIAATLTRTPPRSLRDVRCAQPIACRRESSYGGDIRREAHRGAARADREGELRVPRPRPTDDLGRGVRRAHARAAGPRGEAPRSRHARVADTARRCRSVEPVRTHRTRAPDAQPVERLR